MWYGPMPKSFTTKFRYSSQVIIDATVAGAAWHVYRANGMFDPDQTGFGHQPYGFDQMMAFYFHFTVTSSKITVSSASNNSNPILLAVGVRGDPTTTLLAEDIMEQPMMKTAIMSNQQSGPAIGALTSVFSAEKFFGRPRSAIVGSADYRGSTGAGPAEQAYFHVGIVPNYGGNDPAAQTVQVIVEYTATLTEPRIVIPS